MATKKETKETKERTCEDCIYNNCKAKKDGAAKNCMGFYPKEN